MTTKFTIQDLDLSTPDWILLYTPQNAIPFTTLQGTEHIWNWDFTTGNLLKDGVPLSGAEGYSIVIERYEEEAA
jgi:hypothetical protein